MAPRRILLVLSFLSAGLAAGGCVTQVEEGSLLPGDVLDAAVMTDITSFEDAAVFGEDAMATSDAGLLGPFDGFGGSLEDVPLLDAAAPVGPEPDY